MYEQVSFDFQMSNITFTPIICPANQIIIAYELNDCIKNDHAYHAVHNYFSIESMLKSFMLKYKAALIIKFPSHITLPIKLLTEREASNEIISLPRNDQLSIVIQDIKSINTMPDDERRKTRNSILALHNAGWKMWFENISSEHFDFIKTLCITDFGVKIVEDNLHDNENGLLSIQEKLSEKKLHLSLKKIKPTITS